MRTEGALTVGITTRNRPESLVRCLRSLGALGVLVSRIIVVDDTSDVPFRDALASLDPAILAKLDVVVQTQQQGYIAARNTIVKRADTRYVLLLDDDTYVMDPRPFAEVVRVLEDQPSIGAVACAQATADGEPWAPWTQPSIASFACFIPSFIGFAHVVRRDVFLALGGYREALHYFGEEKEYCLRLLHAGYRVLYMPAALVAHVPDLASRDRAKHLRYIVRNDCLSALYNEPLPLAVASLPVRIARYMRMKRAGGVVDPDGLGWIVRGVCSAVPDIARTRRPVSWDSIRRWRQLRRAPEAFVPAAEVPSTTRDVPGHGAVTVGITTRNRPEAVVRCLQSLERLGDRLARVILVDDTSDIPVSGLLTRISASMAAKVELIVHERSEGNIVGRNEIVTRATTDYVLLLDDDAFVLEAAHVFAGVDVLDAHPAVGAIAYAQAESDGRPWPPGMQPSVSLLPCVVAAYIGFAHLVRRELFLALGGYRETFHFYGEEKDFCLRLLGSGHCVVYLPQALVAHVPDLGNRSQQKQLRHVVRNDCLSSLYNEPWPLALASLPIRLSRHRVMCRAGHVEDPDGFSWIVSGLVTRIPDIWRNRTPVSWGSIRRWRELSRRVEPFNTQAS